MLYVFTECDWFMTDGVTITSSAVSSVDVVTQSSDRKQRVASNTSDDVIRVSPVATHVVKTSTPASCSTATQSAAEVVDHVISSGRSGPIVTSDSRVIGEKNHRHASASIDTSGCNATWRSELQLRGDRDMTSRATQASASFRYDSQCYCRLTLLALYLSVIKSVRSNRGWGCKFDSRFTICSANEYQLI